MKTIQTATILIALIAMISMTGFASATTVTYDSSVTLDNKVDGVWALTPCDGIGAVIGYNFAADEFEWSASGTAPLANTDYSLIYYADPWPGSNPGALIGTMATDANGDFTASGSSDLGMDLPCSPDANINCVPGYCDYDNGFDDYVHCHGAKLWMVPSADYTDHGLTGWNPDDYLFETDLITYTEDAGISIADEFSCGCDDTPVTIPIIVSNGDDVGSVDLTLTYDPSLITAAVANGNMDELSFSVDNVNGQVHMIARQVSNSGLDGKFDLAYITFTPSATNTGISDFGITVTSFADCTFATTQMPYVTKAGTYDVHAYMSGDVNDNGVVDSGDVMVLAKYVVGLCEFQAINECAADVDGNGNIDVQDVSYLVSYLLGISGYTLPSSCPALA